MAAATAGSGDRTAGGGRPGADPDYLAALAAWLERHKRYPDRARRQRAEGTVLVFVELDGAGRVLMHEIRRSSGHRLLDREVRRMIERAQPLPTPRAAPDRLQMVIPVRFALR